MSTIGHDLITEEMLKEATDRIEALEAALRDCIEALEFNNEATSNMALQAVNDAIGSARAALDKDAGK